jgi:hypothetical protein
MSAVLVPLSLDRRRYLSGFGPHLEHMVRRPVPGDYRVNSRSESRIPNLSWSAAARRLRVNGFAASLASTLYRLIAHEVEKVSGPVGR